MTSLRTRIKFCGLTRVEDVTNAVSAGADALGFVFYGPSPRAVTIEQANTLMQHVPAFVSIVALVVNASEEEVSQIGKLPVDIIQYHGDETPAECNRMAQGKRWIKALQVKPEIDLAQISNYYAQAGASAILLDGYDPSQPELKGGTGRAINWQGIENLIKKSTLPIILAGGLTPDNVTTAIMQSKPYAVDVSGGIEIIDANGNKLKGIKDKQKMQRFAELVHRM